MERRKRDSGGEGTTELSRQIERLQRDLTRRERELDEERRETERTIDRMRVLEKDKIELKRELDEVRDEVTEYQRVVDELQQDQVKIKGHQKGEDEDERLNSLRTTLQERNREIGHFIRDLEKIEDEKETLKNKLAEVSGSLEEATAQLTEMAKDRIDIRAKLAKTEDLVGRLEEEKNILQIRERDLLDFKVRHDQQLENLGNAVDIRVDVWKKMMFQKDEEIERLHSKVNDLINKPDNAQLDAEKAAIQRLKMKVKEREYQIRQLAQQLQEATTELNNNTKVIQNLQVEIPHGGSGEETDRVLRSFEKKLRKLESKVEKRGLALGAAEKEAEEKSREIVMLSVRLREYETGQYGLSDAVAEIKDLKGQMRIRDRDLDKLTQEVNQFQIEGSELAEENEMLRKKLGHSAQEDLSKDLKIYTKKRDGDLNALKTKLEVMENEITTLKTRNYELKKLLSAAQEQRQSPKIVRKEADEGVREAEEGHAPLREGYSIGPDAEGWREKYDIILHENTELRKGLQEILDSFQRLSEDDGCNLRIESPILENLLREMSARGLINYPYSISSFHLKVCNLEGKNSQLREELHRTRLWAEGLIEKEKQRSEEWREKAMTAQEMLKDGDGGGKDTELKQRVKEAQLETSRWRRIAEQTEKLNAMLNEKLDESDSKIGELEIRLELISKEPPALHRTTSLVRVPPSTESIGVQTEASLPMTPEKGSSQAGTSIVDFETRLRELENLLAAKDEVIENLQSFSASYDQMSFKAKSPVMMSCPEIEEGLQLARETIQSLTDRLRAKEENLNAYKRILAEVRGEMQLATERHVQDMNALQSTIHQQQLAFTRMKSTLSHPVRDNQSQDIEAIIREQLTRINELEECVRDMEHTMGNVASQLAAARSDAHRSRLTADARLKEIDHLREQLGVGNPTEIESLHETVRVQEEKISELKRSNQTASVLKELLEEKEMEIQGLRASVSTRQPLHKVPTPTPIQTPQPSDQRLGEIEHYRKTNQELQTKLAKLQVRLSKMNATNRASGMTLEMEQLRTEYAQVMEQRDAYRAQVNDLEKHTQEEDEKKRRTVEGFARWDEGKKWKKTVERIEEQKRKLEEERSRLSKQVEDLRALLARLEKEKLILESRLKKGQIKSSTSEQSLNDEGPTNEKLRREIEGRARLLEQKELQASETVERLVMEAQILRERIEMQERQLTAYEVSQKGDPKVVAEIQKLVQSNQRFQQDLANQQQANLDLKLQIQDMKLETPRLRDRVQHLQKLVDTFKNDKSGAQRGTSGRNLTELEKTIAALKSVVEKLEKEQGKPAGGVQLRGTKSALRLRERQEGLIEEKQRLLYQIQEMEEERDRARKLQVDNEARIGDLLHQRDDAQSRAQSAEMRLTTFLEEESIFSERMLAMEKEIERKTQLLAEAKKSIEEITKGKRTTITTTKRP